MSLGSIISTSFNYAWLLLQSSIFLFQKAPTIEQEPASQSIFTTLWESGLSVFRDLVYMAIVALAIYCMWKHIKRLHQLEQNDFRTADPDTKSPTIYNTNNNIHIWLAQVEDYLDAKKIVSDKAKQKVVIDKLDKTSRLIINDLVQQKKIKSYQQIEEHLKCLYDLQINLQIITFFNSLNANNKTEKV